MGIAIPAEVKALLDGPNIAHLADRSPQSVPAWVRGEQNRIIISTGENSLKAKDTLRDSRGALPPVGGTNPYEEALLRGSVVVRGSDGQLTS